MATVARELHFALVFDPIQSLWLCHTRGTQFTAKIVAI